MYVQYVYPGRFSALVSLFCCDCVIPNIFVYVCVGVGLLGIGKAPCLCMGVCTGVCTSASHCVYTHPCLCVCFLYAVSVCVPVDSRVYARLSVYVRYI